MLGDMCFQEKRLRTRRNHGYTSLAIGILEGCPWASWYAYGAPFTHDAIMAGGVRLRSTALTEIGLIRETFGDDLALTWARDLVADDPPANTREAAAILRRSRLLLADDLRRSRCEVGS